MADDDGAAKTIGSWGSLISGAAGVKNLTNIAKTVADSDLTPGQQEAADSAERKKRAQPNDTPSTDYAPDPTRKDRPSKSYGVGEGDQQSNNKPSLDYMRHFTQPDILAVGHNTGDSAVSKKISTLVHEGTPQKQAVATALSMKRAGRLTKEGGYIRARKMR